MRRIVLGDGVSGGERCPPPLPNPTVARPLPVSGRHRTVPLVSVPQPTSRPFVRQRASGPFWYGKWSRDGKPVMRALGRAWVSPDGHGGWKHKRGRAPDGMLTEAQASARMLDLVQAHHIEQGHAEQDAEERRRRGVTFRELVHEWLVYLEREKGAKPSTLIDYGWMVAERGQPHRRGQGRSPGLLMAALGDRPISELTTREIGAFLRALDERGCKPRTVNRHRQLICAAFNYAMREDTYAVARNPAAGTTKRREPPPAVLDFYEPDEVETLARAAELSAHRAARPDRLGEQELAVRRREDSQDADLYRIAAYTGLRLGELLALRWEDVNLDLRRLVVHRAISAGIEGPTKGWQARFVPLSDGAADAFARLHERGEFTSCDRLRVLQPLWPIRSMARPSAGGSNEPPLPRACESCTSTPSATAPDRSWRAKRTPAGSRDSSATPRSPPPSATYTPKPDPKTSTG